MKPDIDVEITSDNAEILQRSLSFIDESLDKEKRREDIAENRARNLIIFTSIATTALISLTRILNVSRFLSTLNWKILFAVSLIFLIKATYFTFRAVEVKKYNRLNPTLIQYLQRKSFKGTLRHEIRWKIWEYKQKVAYVNERLFWVARGHRNFLLMIFTVLLLVAWTFLSSNVPKLFHEYTDYVRAIKHYGILTILSSYGVFAVFSDYILEKSSEFWNFS